MSIRHHLTDALLMAYAAGTLPEAFALVAATHVSMCDTCRATLAAFDAVGGAVLKACAPEMMSAGSLNATLARLDRPVLIPAQNALEGYIGGDLAAVKWRSIGLGVRQAILPTSRTATARLLYIPAGQAVPDHGHRGTELTLVLQGAFADERDAFGPGDLEIADQEVKHTPKARPGMACICLAATDAPLRFTSLLPRLLQPLFRI